MSVATEAQPESPNTVLVGIMTYNERENIEPLVREVLAQGLPTDIVIIDDNSPDGTGDIADRLAAELPEVAAVHRAGKLGLGTAHVAAMKYAIEHDYEHLVTLDADFSHHPRYLPAILEQAKHYDLVIGSRYIPGGGVKNWGLKRRFMSWGANTYVRLVLRLKPRDNSGAYRCYRVAALRRLDLDRMRAVGYSFMEEMIFRCQRAGFSFTEIPIIFEDRRSGLS